MKVKLNRRDRAQLQSLRKHLVQHLAASDAATKAHSALRKEAEGYQTQIDELEEISAPSDAQINGLAVKREKLRFLNRRIAAAERPGEADLHELAHALTLFKPIFQRLIYQVQRDLENQILRAISPFYYDEGLHSGLDVVQRSDAMHLFGNFVGGVRDMAGDVHRQSRQAITIIDKFLKGQSPWQLPK